MPTTNLTLRVQPGTDALHRVICVCHRRRLEILELSYADQEIRLTIAGDDSQVRQIRRWLVALVHVFGVDRWETAGRPALGSAPVCRREVEKLPTGELAAE